MQFINARLTTIHTHTNDKHKAVIILHSLPPTHKKKGYMYLPRSFLKIQEIKWYSNINLKDNEVFTFKQEPYVIVCVVCVCVCV